VVFGSTLDSATAFVAVLPDVALPFATLDFYTISNDFCEPSGIRAVEFY
jgi:hypothetical protein